MKMERLNSRVVVVEGENARQMILKGLRYFPYPSKKKVVLKPNLITSQPPPTTTPPDVVEALVEYYQMMDYEVVVAEGSGWAETEHAYEVLGYTKIAEKHGIKLVDLNKDQYEIKEDTEALVLKRFEFPLTLKDSYIVSIPILKEHSITTVTLSLKNMLGATVGEKGRFHRSGLDKNIVDINLYIKPSLAVIDGRVAGVGRELGARPKKLGLMIFSEDLVAADAVGARYLGYDPLKIGHLKLGQEKGLGTANLEKIDVIMVKT